MAIKCPKYHFANPNDTTYCVKCATLLQSSEDIAISSTNTIRKPLVNYPIVLEPYNDLIH